MSNNAAREHWEGDTKIVIGVIIGTTESSVAFAFLQKGVRQTVHRVNQWPGQMLEYQSKVPTLVWYDGTKRAVSFGAEAILSETKDQAEDSNWSLAKNFKLHLHPDNLQAKYNIKLDGLPPGVSLRQVYSDFLGYLLQHTRSYFRDRIVDGKVIWEQYSPAMEVIIAHPNNWSVREEAFLRSAAVAAGFSTSDQALSKPGTNLVVCDAGNSTVETTLYSVISAHPVLKLTERRASACAQAGTLFVDLELERFLRKTLEGAGLNADDVADYTKAGVEDFGGTVKRLFTGEATDLRIRISFNRFNDPSIGVRRGIMTVSGSTIKGFFDTCINQITGSVDKQLDGFSAQHILLIGEFSSIPYLRQVFQKRYEPRGSRVTFVDDYTSSGAIADGAVLWSAMLTTHKPKQRTPRSSWGIETSVALSDTNPDHRDRKSVSSVSGRTMIPGRWHGLIRKGMAINEDAMVRVPITLDFPPSPSELGEFKLDLYHYSGDDEPVWMRDKQGGLLPQFCQAVRICNDLKALRGALRSRIARDGILQCQLNFDICLQFGGVELAAYPEWEEQGTIQTDRCTLIPIIDEA